MKAPGRTDLQVHEVRVSHMQEAGLVIKEEPYTMRVPRSQRGGEVIEPLVREQWFVRMQPLAEPALKVPCPAHDTHSSLMCLDLAACSVWSLTLSRPFSGAVLNPYVIMSGFKPLDVRAEGLTRSTPPCACSCL